MKNDSAYTTNASSAMLSPSGLEAPSSLPFLSRPRLESILTALPAHTILHIEAPAGYGKTNLLYSVFANQPKAGSVSILDDIQTIDSSLLQYRLERMCQECPEDGSLIISARNHSLLLPSSWPIQKITAQDLAFTPEEVREYTRLLFPQESEQNIDKKFNILWGLSQGWPLALSTLAVVLKQEPEASPDILCRSVAPLILDYLQEEVMAFLDDDTRRFIYCAAPLPSLDAQLCDNVFRRNDSAMLLKLIHQTTPLLTCNNGVYRFVPVCGRSIASLKFATEASQRGSLVQASRAYANKGHFPFAVSTAFIASDYPLASHFMLKESNSECTGKEMTALLFCIAASTDMPLLDSPSQRAIDTLHAWCQKSKTEPEIRMFTDELEEKLLRFTPLNQTQSPSQATGLMNKEHMADLSKRETDILKMLVEGNTIRDIAQLSCVSELTVRTQLKSIYRKLNVHSKVEAINKAISRGIV